MVGVGPAVTVGAAEEVDGTGGAAEVAGLTELVETLGVAVTGTDDVLRVELEVVLRVEDELTGEEPQRSCTWLNCHVRVVLVKPNQRIEVKPLVVTFVKSLNGMTAFWELPLALVVRA